MCFKVMACHVKQYFYGVKKGIPILVGFLPVAISYAILAQNAGLTVAETIGMSASVFAGASQIMAVGMLAEGAGVLPVILSTFVLNLRHIIMSVCVFRKLKTPNRWIRFLIGFGVTDETFALFTMEDEEKSDEFFMLGLVSIAYFSWVAGAVLGVVAGNLLPYRFSQSFGIALYALFLSLLVPDLKKSWRLLLTVLITIALNCLLCLLMDKCWAIIISTLLGAAVGVGLTENDSGIFSRPSGKESLL